MVRRMKLAQKNEQSVPQSVKDEIKGIDAGRPTSYELYVPPVQSPLPFLHVLTGTCLCLLGGYTDSHCRMPAELSLAVKRQAQRDGKTFVYGGVPEQARVYFILCM